MPAQPVAFPLHPAAKPQLTPANPRKLNARQEEFCCAYVQLGNGAKAAFRAGYSGLAARQQAARLLTNANILQRIAELRRDLGLRNSIDRETVMAKLEAAYRGAINAGCYLTAVRAAEAQARLAGLFPDRESEPAPNPKSNGAAKTNGGARKPAAADAPLGADHAHR